MMQGNQMLDQLLDQLNHLDLATLRRLQPALQLLIDARSREQSSEDGCAAEAGAAGAAESAATQEQRSSLQVEYRTCGKSTCRCASGQKHGPYLYLAYRRGTRVVREYKGKL